MQTFDTNFEFGRFKDESYGRVKDNPEVSRKHVFFLDRNTASATETEEKRCAFDYGGRDDFWVCVCV